jgi:hypothetical protein
MTNQPSSAADRLVAFVLAKAESEPLAQAVQIYRDTAEVLASEAHSERLQKIADDLDDARARVRQLLLAI